TVVALTASDRLGVPLDKITVELGDSDLPPAPVAGGSNTTASVCNVVAKACGQIRSRIAQAAVDAANGVFAGKDAGRLVLTDGMLRDPDGGYEWLEAAIRRVWKVTSEAFDVHIAHGVQSSGLCMVYHGNE